MNSPGDRLIFYGEVMIMSGIINYDTMEISEDMQYEGVTVLSYQINYPQFHSKAHNRTANRVNQFYRGKALLLQNSLRNNLFRKAVDRYLLDKEEGFPLLPFEALQTFEVTYNKDCIISLYFDNYQYTGGAHGVTPRNSQTWNLKTGKMMTLKELFRCTTDFGPYFKHKIIEQIAEDPEFYFDDYRELVEKTFDPDNFYCTPEGIMVYFQQYDIAPYSSGIREFLFPYNKCIDNPSTKCEGQAARNFFH
ncbi:MAG: DUF3298 and DUF4163 domain-containing protein [Clostridia bacterium]|nr:DUF3298 and DUF4163 domain-containing protein [Clostridia bacterium]